VIEDEAEAKVRRKNGIRIVVLVGRDVDVVHWSLSPKLDFGHLA